MVLPLISPSRANRSSTQREDLLMRFTVHQLRLVRDIVTWSGVLSSSPMDRNRLNVSESASRHAMPRSLSSPSKNPIIMMRKYRPGASDGRPSLAW